MLKPQLNWLMCCMLAGLVLVCGSLYGYAQIMPTAEDAQEYMNKGLNYAKKGKLEDAREKFQEAIIVTPSSPQAHYNLGTVYSKQGKISKAVVEYKTAAQFAPNNPMVHNTLGKAYSRQGHWNEAISEYHQALRSTPHSAAIHENLADAYCATKRWDLARLEYQKLAAIGSPSAGRILKRLSAHGQAGAKHTSKRNKPSAIKAKRKPSPLKASVKPSQKEKPEAISAKLEALKGQTPSRVSKKPALPVKPHLRSAPAKKYYTSQNHVKKRPHIPAWVVLIGICLGIALCVHNTLSNRVRRLEKIAYKLAPLFLEGQSTQLILQRLRHISGKINKNDEEMILMMAWRQCFEAKTRKIFEDQDVELLQNYADEFFPSSESVFYNTDFYKQFQQGSWLTSPSNAQSAPKQQNSLPTQIRIAYDVTQNEYIASLSSLGTNRK